jgi:hypothetical protein
VVALHPMAGYRSAEPFALDAGRMCVTVGSQIRCHRLISNVIWMSSMTLKVRFETMADCRGAAEGRAEVVGWLRAASAGSDDLGRALSA